MSSKIHHSHHTTGSKIGMYLHTVLAFVDVQQQIKRSSSNFGNLSEDYVFTDTVHPIILSVRCCFHQNIHSLLKGTLGERPGVLSVHTMPGDSHQMTLLTHDLAQE